MEAMKTVHQLLLSDEYIAESQRINIAQNRTLRFLYQTWWVWWLPRIIFAGVMVFCLAFRQLWEAGLFGGALLFSFLGERSSRRSLLKARSRVRAKGTTTMVSMHEQGIDIVGALATSHLRWEALRHSVVMSDGVLIKITSAHGLWLPDCTLVEGTPEEVRQLISVKAGNSQVAPKN